MSEIKAITREFQTCAFDKDAPLPIQISEPVNPERIIRFRASDDSLDRHNEVILPEGWDLANFVKNPVMMLFHDYNSLPVGKITAAGVVDNALYLDGEFDPPEIDELAEMVFQKIQHGTINAGSVGFIPKEVVVPGVKTRDLFERYPKAERIYSKCELLEWTVCPVPANPNALAAHIKGLTDFYEVRKEQFGAESVDVSADVDTATTAEDTDAEVKAVKMKVWDMAWRLKHPMTDAGKQAAKKDGE